MASQTLLPFLLSGEVGQTEWYQDFSDALKHLVYPCKFQPTHVLHTLSNWHSKWFPKNDVCPFFCLLLCKLMPNGNDFLVSMEILTAKASDYVVPHSHGSWLEHRVPSVSQSCQHVAPILHPRTTCKPSSPKRAYICLAPGWANCFVKLISSGMEKLRLLFAFVPRHVVLLFF